MLDAFRDLFFNSRELLDLLLLQINQITSTSKLSAAPKDFLPFSKGLMQGKFDGHNLEIITFLKTNITYIFDIRKIRNEIKINPAIVEFNFNTDHFEARCITTINKDEVDLIGFLDISNKEEALKNMSYSHVYNLDLLFPEMFSFWNTVFSIYNKDLEILKAKV